MGHRVFDTCFAVADNRVCFAAILKLQCIEEPAGTAERDEFDLFHAFASLHRLAGIVELHFADQLHRSDITQVYIVAERSEEYTSEPQSRDAISYAGCCFKKTIPAL